MLRRAPECQNAHDTEGDDVGEDDEQAVAAEPVVVPEYGRHVVWDSGYLPALQPNPTSFSEADLHTVN